MTKLVRHLLPHRFQTSLGFLVALAMMLSPALLFGQSTPVSAFLSPPDGLESGDLVDLTIEYGTEETPSDYITEAHFEIILPEGMSVAEGSSEEVTGESSWFAIDEDWYGTVETDPSGREMLVSLYRRDEEEVRGHGEIAVVKGIIIDVTEISMKGPAEISIDGRSANHSQISFTYERQGNILQLEGVPSGAVTSVMDLSGREIVAPSTQHRLTINTSPQQLLVVFVRGEDNRTGYRMLKWD